MSRLQSLKVLIQQRLTAAVEEIMGHLDRTITECEEEMMEYRHRHLTAAASEPEIQLQTAVFSVEVQQQLLIKEEQEWSASLDQGDSEHTHIKEENEDFSATQSEQLQGQHEKNTSFPFCHVSVKTEDDKETPDSSQLHVRQSGEKIETEPTASSSSQEHQKPNWTVVSGFKCGSEDKTSHSSESVTEESGDDWKERRKPQTDLNTIKNKGPVNDMGHRTGSKSFGCSKCGKKFGQKHHLQTHMRCHTGEKPFSCSVCGKRFTQKGNLTQHLSVHTREKPCSCPVCGERFAQKGNLTQHMTVHTREKMCW